MNSPIGWIGGKRALRQEIIALFPQDGVGRYIEVFFGAGWVFFGREKRPGQLEVINDRDGQLVNLFRCIKYHRAALQEELEWLVSAREIFFAAMAQLILMGSQIFSGRHGFSTCSKIRLEITKKPLQLRAMESDVPLTIWSKFSSG